MSLPLAVLAGGLATRMRPLTESLPKSLLEVAGEPFIAHQLRLLAKSGIRRVVLCIGFLGEQIETVVGDGRRFGLDVAYSSDGPQLLGTGGALKKALPLLGESFMVLYGDSYLEIDYHAVEEAFFASGQSALMCVYKNRNLYDHSNIRFGNGRVLAYDKRHPTPDMEFIDYGLGCIERRFLQAWPQDCFDVADFYAAASRNNQLAGFAATTRFYEIGSKDGLADLERHLSAGNTPQGICTVY